MCVCMYIYRYDDNAICLKENLSYNSCQSSTANPLPLLKILLFVESLSFEREFATIGKS